MQVGYFSVGKILALIGFIGYIPIGLIGAMGVRKIADARSRAEAGV